MVSRQREWQLRKRAEGRCETCGKKRHPRSSQYCLSCLRKKRKSCRRRLGYRPHQLGRRGRIPLERQEKCHGKK